MPIGGQGAILPVSQNIELREDGTYELREDNNVELRDQGGEFY
jgi:hypothetical protein